MNPGTNPVKDFTQINTVAKILVATGTSGGHAFPAFGLLDVLKEQKGCQTLLVIPSSSRRNNIDTSGYNTKYISVENLKLRPFSRGIRSFFNFAKGSMESFIILSRFRPDVVVAFGSIACVPIILFSWIFRIKTVIHEQNVMPGKANLFLAWFADKIAVSFPHTGAAFKVSGDKIIVTGNPLRKDMVCIEKNKALSFFGFKPDKFTIAATGGSLGSSFINREFSKAVSTMNHKFRIQVIHVCGESDFEELNKRYVESVMNIKLFKFLKSMQYFYSASDLVVCRAGAMTVAELVFFRVPAIIIPYPYANKHQSANAKVLEEAGSAVLFQEGELDTDILKQAIDGIITDESRLRKMRESYKNISFSGAADILAQEVLSLN